jgi:microcystin degradation protein MlrC
MKIAAASIMQESNTFSPVATRYADFSPVFGEPVIARHRGKLTEVGGFLDVLGKAKATPVAVCAAWAITAGRMVRADFNRLAAGFARHLRRAGKVDGLLLAMHGAQTAEGVDDVEGHILGIAREILGPAVPIVLTLDLHANITQAMIQRATAIVGYHTYPHVDMFETGQKAARILLRTLGGQLTPRMAWRKIPLIVNAEKSQTTWHDGPFGRLMRRAGRIESRGQALAVSLFPTQPWMDIEEMGCAVVTVTDGDQPGAQRLSDQLARSWWATKEEFEPELVGVEDALRAVAMAPPGLCVFAESSDSTGSGSPGDSTGVLRHLVKAKLDGPAAIFLVDPAAVAAAHRAGVGARVKMRIGGAFDTVNSKPVGVNAHVKMLADGRWTPRARGYNPGIEQSMGRSAVLEMGQVLILVAERSTMTVDPALFRSHGIDPLYCRIVTVKSPAGFRAAYEPIASAVFLVDTPGVSTAKLDRLPWHRISRPIYPLDRGTKFEISR